MQNARRNSRKANGLTPTIISKSPYIGRFAPSPTGPLHLGSLYTAVASFLDAKVHNGQWLLRIDDLDTPRNTPQAAEQILKTLEAFELHWDGEVAYQSQQKTIYEEFLAELAEKKLVYACGCSRKQLAGLENQSDIYPGFCRNKSISSEIPCAMRIKTEPEIITFIDGIQGMTSYNVAAQQGDFVLKRKDHIFAYQFAVVIDDYLQKVTHVVRGVDLLDSTPKQIYLQQKLGISAPHYMHVPVIVDNQGYKLSKQTQAQAVQSCQPNSVVFDLLTWLKQNPPIDLQNAPVTEQLAWAILHWQPEHLNNLTAIAMPMLNNNMP